MGYENFYNFKDRPFAITPDPRFFFESSQHQGALIRIKDAIDNSKGLVVLIGDIGLGKTFVSRKLIEKLQEEEEKYEASLFIVIHHEITVAWFLKTIAIQLGVENPIEDKSKLVSQICMRLVEIDQQNRKAIILVDEAHMLQTQDIYEELRGLLNVEGENHKLLNVVLFGPPELEKFLALDPPLVSRIGLKYTLKPLDEAETQGYIIHRVKIAGSAEPIFTVDAAKMVYLCSHGIPRLINTICENALLEGFLEKEKEINVEMVEKSAIDLGLHPPAKVASPEEIKEKQDKEKQQKKKDRISYI